MTSTKPAVREAAEPVSPEPAIAASTGKRRLLPRAERRAQILSAAATAFAQRGYSDTSMDEVANRAGITKLIVYRHFGSKSELYQAVLESVFGRLAEVLIERIPDMVGHGAVPGSLMAVAREQPDAMRLLMVHSAREPEFSELYLRYEAVSLSVAATVLGDTGAPELDRWQARLLAEFVAGGILNWVDDGDPARDEEVVKRLSQGARGMAAAWRELPPEPPTSSDDS